MILSLLRRSTSQKKRTKSPSGGNVLAIGLGNPDKEYDGTRHNAGRDAVTLFAKRSGLVFEEKRDMFSDVASGILEGRKIFIARPTVFMNQSGKAVAALANFYRIKPDGVVILHDDMDLPFGTVKIVFGRGSGGHKGVESVFRALKTRDIVRIRIGVMGRGRSQKPGKRALEVVVIKRMTPDEKTAFAKGIRKAGEALETAVSKGWNQAMNQHN